MVAPDAASAARVSSKTHTPSDDSHMAGRVCVPPGVPHPDTCFHHVGWEPASMVPCAWWIQEIPVLAELLSHSPEDSVALGPLSVLPSFPM